MGQDTFRQLAERAELQLAAGNWDAARALWLEALALVPDSAEAMLELSYVESLAGRYRIARDWTLRAVQARPRSVEGLAMLVQRLRTFNDVPVLRGIAGGLVANPGVPHGLLVECARQLSNLNDFTLALQCAEAAVARAPVDPAARMVRAQLLVQHARIDEATGELERVVQHHPRAATAWWMLSRLHRQTPQSNHVPQLRALLATPGLRPEDAAFVARALHKELDDLGDHEGAWQALETMCRAKRSTVSYDRMESRRLADRLMAWSPGGPAIATAPGNASPVPVFIVGMHRSGTTLVEQMLDASQDVRALGELADFTCAMRHATDHYCKGAIDAALVERASEVDFAEVGRRYLDGIAWRLGNERFFTDKLPSNFLAVGFICRALPQAKILHMWRDPVETCFSNLRELFSDINAYSYDQHDLADYFLQYRKLMAHWHVAFPGRILDVDYGRLTADPEATMREVAAFCGIGYVDGMCNTSSSKRAVSTASSVQVREGVVRREQPRWAPYARQLRPLIDALRDGGVEVGG